MAVWIQAGLQSSNGCINLSIKEVLEWLRWFTGRALEDHTRSLSDLGWFYCGGAPGDTLLLRNSPCPAQQRCSSLK
jgi:hypothetical protein